VSKPAPRRRGSKEAAGPSTPAFGEADASSLTFVGRRSQIKTPVAQCRLARTIEGASSITVTIHDPHLAFLNSDAIRDAPTSTVHKSSSRHSPLVRKANLHAVVVLDNLAWALTGIGLQPGHQVQAILEEDAVKALRNTKPLTMSRGAVTRAQFIKRMFDDAGVPFYAPELDVKQRIETPQEAETEKQREHKRKPGLAPHAKLTIKQQPMDSEQRQNVEDALAEAARLAAGHLPTLAMMVAGIGESDFRKTAVAHSQNGAQVGVFQSDKIPADDTTRQAHYFLKGGESFQAGGAIALAASDPSLTPGDIATRVEASGQPGAFYDVWVKEAEEILAAYTGGDSGGFNGEPIKYAKSYQFQRKRGETSWACARRLADEVNWYLFIEGGVGYYMSGSYLKRSKPRMLVAEGADGIRSVTFKVMESPQHDDTITVECDAKLWQAPPGSIAEVQGYGPVDDRWVVTDISRANMSQSLTVVTLGRLKEPKLEPAHELGTFAAPSSGSATVVGDSVQGGSIRDRVVAAAMHAAELSKGDPSYFHYSQAGSWKFDLFKRDAPGDRSDCSSFVIQAYEKAGCKLPASMHGQGFTGTLAEAGRKVSTPKPGDICLYGTFPYHHVELYIGGGKTIGHGSPPIDEDSPRDPALGEFAGFWTFGFLDE
jgi:hypothetical protein